MKLLPERLAKKLKDSLRKTGDVFRRIFNKFAPKEKYLVGLFVFILIGSLLAIGVQFYTSRTQVVPADGGELREALVGLPRFINPVLAITNDVDRDLVRLIYSGLMTYDVDGNMIPLLAESYEISSNGREYKFTLKDNLKWEDGIPLTMEDVLFTIEIIQNPEFGSPLFQSWQNVKASTEDGVLILSLPSAYPPFLENTTLGILPKHIWQNVTSDNFTLTDLNLSPIGSGPFKVEKFTKDSSGLLSSYTLERNNNYHDKKPHLNKLTFKFYPNEDEAIRAYNANAVDSLSFISPSSLDKLQNIQNVNLYEFKMPRYFAIFINQERNELLKDKSMREALAHATNREEIARDVLKSYARPVDTPIPPNLTKYYNRNTSAPKYDIEKSRELLENLGWQEQNEDGIRQKIVEDDDSTENLIFTLTTGANPELERVATRIKEQWREAGILLNIDVKELAELQQDSIRNKTYELLLFGTILGAIPDPYSFWHSSQSEGAGLNLSRYNNEEVDTLLGEARREVNEERRIQQYEKFQEIVVNDVPAVFLYDLSYIYPINRVVKGVKTAFITDTSSRFINVTEWYIETKRVF